MDAHSTDLASIPNRGDNLDTITQVREKSPETHRTKGQSKNQETTSESGLSRFGLSLWHFAVDQWFLVVMGILIAIASQAQVPGSAQKVKKNILNYLAVAIIFFINGCTTPTDILVENLRRWKMHIYVQILCYLFTSAIAFGLVQACAVNRKFMDDLLLDGFIILGCLPTAISFNAIMTRKAHGNTALTITQSSIGNLLGPFLSTVLIKLYTSNNSWFTQALPRDDDDYSKIYRQVFKQLGLAIFVPLTIGQILSQIFPKTIERGFEKWKLAKLSSFALLAIIWGTYDGAFESDAFNGIHPGNLVFLVFLCIVLFLVCFIAPFLASRLFLTWEDSIAVAYLVPTKTPAMGVPLVTIMFAGLTAASQSRLQLVMVIYQAVQTSLSSLSTIGFRRWKSPVESSSC